MSGAADEALAHIASMEFSQANLAREFDLETTQAKYLWTYLQTLGAKTLIVESAYVDRHYLDDFATYYARSFIVPRAHCRRIHFFAGSAVDDLNHAFDEVYSAVDAASRRSAEMRIADIYLGFVVCRPLQTARLGRTVLRTYPADGRRQFTVLRPYTVHIAGVALTIQGLAYQEQDGGAAVCASTALWCALQKVAHMAGNRTPTPSQITSAAGSPFPASFGLDDVQMAAALSNLGYTADHFVPAENRAMFRAKVATYLRSHLPVVLLLAKDHKTGAGQVEVGHAVTATGYSEPADAVLVPGATPAMLALPMRGGSISTLYVHDDNLGSHAHYELHDLTEERHGHLALGLLRGRSSTAGHDSWWAPDQWFVEGALVPKPWKLRMPIEDLFGLLWQFRPSLELALAGLELDYEARLTSGVAYRTELFGMGFASSTLRQFQERLHLPRHVGVISVRYEALHICDVLVDVTQIDRGDTAVLAVVAPVVPRNSAAFKRLEHVSSQAFGAPPIISAT
jgi:hypothetical protein